MLSTTSGGKPVQKPPSPGPARSPSPQAQFPAHIYPCRTGNSPNRSYHPQGYWLVLSFSSHIIDARTYSNLLRRTSIDTHATIPHSSNKQSRPSTTTTKRPTATQQKHLEATATPQRPSSLPPPGYAPASSVPRGYDTAPTPPIPAASSAAYLEVCEYCHGVGRAHKRPCDTAFRVFQTLPPEIANLDHADHSDRAARAKAAAERAAASQARAQSEQCKYCKVRDGEHMLGCALANDQFAPGPKADAGAVVGRKRGRREDEQLLALDRESAEMRELRKRRVGELLGERAGSYLAQQERDARELG